MGEEQIKAAFAKLNKRECVLGAYITHHLPVTTTDGHTHEALVYTATPECVNYMGPNDLEEMARDIVLSHGHCGPNTEYLFRLADFMREVIPWVQDDHLFDLDEAAKKLMHLQCNNRCLSPSSSITPSTTTPPSFTRTEKVMSTSSASFEMQNKTQHPEKAIQPIATQVLV